MLATDKKEYSILLKLGIPIVVGQLGITIQGVVDTIMLGHYSSNSLAAAGFVNSLFTFASVMVMGFAVGVIPLCGSACGRGDKAACVAVFKNSLATITVVALVAIAALVTLFLNIDILDQPKELIGEMTDYFWFTIPSMMILAWSSVFKSFFDSLTYTKVAMYAILIGNLWNIIMNFMLIYGLCGMPRLGVIGAGIATSTSRLLILMVYVVALFYQKSFRDYCRLLTKTQISWAGIKQLTGMGFPISLQSGFEVGSFSLCSIFVGWMGANDLAANQIMISLTSTIWIVYFGIATATSVRVSNFMGCSEFASIRFTSRCGLKMILCCAVVLNIAFLTCHSFIFSWFTDDMAIVDKLVLLLTPIVLYQFSDALQTNYVNVLRGMGHVRYLMLDSFIAYVIVALPTSYFLGITCDFGIIGIWMTYPIALSVAAILYIWRYRRLMANYQ